MTPKRTIGHTDLYLRLGVNTQAWREFCRAEQLLAQRDELLAALRTLTDALGRVDWDSLPQTTMDKFRSTRAAATNARAAIAKATQE
jgi:hypothetical protein